MPRSGRRAAVLIFIGAFLTGAPTAHGEAVSVPPGCEPYTFDPASGQITPVSPVYCGNAVAGQTGVAGARPRVTITGRLHSLKEKQLYADDYSMTIDAQPRSGPVGGLVGITSIEVRIDNVRELYAQQTCVGCSMSRSFTYQGRNRPAGPQRIEVNVVDALLGKYTEEWTIYRSDWDPLPYEWEFIRDAKEFRTNFQLPADDAWVDQTIHETAYVPSRKRYNFPLSPDEEDDIEDDPSSAPETDGAGLATPAGQTSSAAAAGRRDRDFNRQGVFDYAEYWWDKTRGGQFGRFENDCTNFVSQAWHFGGGMSMTKGWFIKKENIRGWPFDDNREFSKSWTVVEEFANYMTSERRVAEKLNARPTQNTHPGLKGDAIMYDHGRGGGWSHMAVAIGTQATGIDRIAQHTVDRWSAVWNWDWVSERNKRFKAHKRAIVIHALKAN